MTESKNIYFAIPNEIIESSHGHQLMLRRKVHENQALQGAKGRLLVGYKEKRKTLSWNNQAVTWTTQIHLADVNSGTASYDEAHQVIQYDEHGPFREVFLPKKLIVNLTEGHFLQL